MFKHHYIRSNLIQTWLKYSKYLPKERPLWIVSEEVKQFVSGSKTTDLCTYQDLRRFEKKEVAMKTEMELKIKYGWWSYLRIKDLFNKDKREFGFREQKAELEIILLGDQRKMLSKIYKLLLKRYSADEKVKEQIVKCP